MAQACMSAVVLHEPQQLFLNNSSHIAAAGLRQDVLQLPPLLLGLFTPVVRPTSSLSQVNSYHVTAAIRFTLARRCCCCCCHVLHICCVYKHLRHLHQLIVSSLLACITT
jgi:hypothetical protein